MGSGDRWTEGGDTGGGVSRWPHHCSVKERNLGSNAKLYLLADVQGLLESCLRREVDTQLPRVTRTLLGTVEAVLELVRSLLAQGMDCLCSHLRRNPSGAQLRREELPDFEGDVLAVDSQALTTENIYEDIIQRVLLQRINQELKKALGANDVSCTLAGYSETPWEKEQGEEAKGT